MRKIYLLFAVLCISIAAFAGPEKKKPKLIDHYYVDSDGFITDYDGSYKEFKVYEDADSIVVHAFLAKSGDIVSVNTYKTLNDSVAERWGTQLTYYFPGGNLRRYQFIDPALGSNVERSYDEKGMLEQETIVNLLTGVSTKTTWYSSGKKKSFTKTERNLKNEETSDAYVWFENGSLKREQKTSNFKIEALKLYEENGARILSIPVQEGDTIFLNKENGAVSRKDAIKYGVAYFDGDSIKFNTYNLKDKLISEENYMTYTPDEAVSWGVQRYYYENAPQKTDSLFVYRGVNGVDLLSRKFYPDGKLMSETTVTYNNVMLPVKELRQFYPSGVLRRYQKHLGEKLVEGHVYNSEGKETEPFFEFKE